LIDPRRTTRPFGQVSRALHGCRGSWPFLAVLEPNAAAAARKKIGQRSDYAGAATGSGKVLN